MNNYFLKLIPDLSGYTGKGEFEMKKIMIRKNKVKHLIELVKDGSVVDSAITKEEVEYLKQRGFKVEKDYFKLYRIQKGE